MPICYAGLKTMAPVLVNPAIVNVLDVELIDLHAARNCTRASKAPSGFLLARLAMNQGGDTTGTVGRKRELLVAGVAEEFTRSAREERADAVASKIDDEVVLANGDSNELVGAEPIESRVPGE